MSRPVLHHLFVAATTFVVAVSFSPRADSQEEGQPPAEVLRLASQSLLLDVMSTAEGRLVAVGERGHVVTSSDGDEWTQAEVVPTRSTLTTVAGSGNDLWAGGHDTVIIHSSDGGRTWTLKNFDPDRAQPIMDLYFPDASTGYAIGAYGLMMKTTDGGETWEEFEVSPDSWHLNGLIDFGGGRLVITGEAGFSYTSDDAGETWMPIEMPYPGSMFGAVRAGDCVIAHGLRGNVQRSCDAGETWEELPTPTESSLAGAAHRDGVTVMVGNSGQVLVIDAQGQMTTEQHPSGVDFAAVIPLEDGRWLLVGENGRHYYPAGERG